MENFRETHLPFLVWLFVICLMGLFILLYGWAKKQKGVAMAIGILVQMFLPDPKAQQTIEFIVESKQEKSEKASPSQSDEDNKK